MPDRDESLAAVPQSRVVVKKRTRLSLVWVIPIVAAAAGIWIGVTKIRSQGPEITIEFQSGDGLEADKTKVDYNGLDVGKITSIRVTDDHKRVIATVRMAPKSDAFLVKDTKFWVVRPRMTGLNVTGLSTLLSGNYIGMELGESRERERNFVALDSPPIVASDTPGRSFVLTSPELGSLTQGTPIYFRQLQAGQVVSYELDHTGQFMNVKIFVQAPFDTFVTPDTRFWQASGIDLSLSASGLRVHTESLISILAGGIAFETPATDSPLPPAESNTGFTLFDDRADAFKPPPRNPHSFALVFNQSVRGLVPGAPVTMSGVPIGEVTDIHAQFDTSAMAFTVRVTVSVDPERYGVEFVELPPGRNLTDVNKAGMDAVVSRGLRARLQSGSLISGALYVSFDLVPDAPPASVDWSQRPPELPTVPGQLEGIEASIADIAKKLNQVQFKEISDDLRNTIGELDKTLVSGRGTLTNVDHLLSSADKLIEPNSALVDELHGSLQEAGDAARALRVLADYLERHPEALIRGKTGESR